MQLNLPGRPHLTYCTNIHPGETWSEINRALSDYLPRIKQRVSPNQSMGVGLRLSAIAAEELASSPALNDLKHFLADHDLYVFTINAFPFGPFHGQRVKEHVYEPDWRRPERLTFTTCVADILAQLLPDGADGSISTVPGAFKSSIKTKDDVLQVTSAFVDCAAYLCELRKKTGHSITLALEPEPACFLETTEEAIAFFREHLFGPLAVARFEGLTGISRSEALDALRRHLGLCLDVCHSAVGFEDTPELLAAAKRAGIQVAKLQLSAALKVTCSGPEIESVLSQFDDGIYLHQTVQSRNNSLRRYLDLSDAFTALRNGEAGGEWRVHCHVPVFLKSFEALQSTQSALRDVLKLCRVAEVSPHLEVETYTWGVLPPLLRHSDLSEDIAREIKWVREELGA